MTEHIHVGEARRLAVETLSGILSDGGDIEKVVLGQDLFGLLRVILWLPSGIDEDAVCSRVSAALAKCERFWTGDVWTCSGATSRADKLVYSSAWDEGIDVPGVDNLRIDDRTRTRTAWLPRFRQPAWEARRNWRTFKVDKEPEQRKGPPTVVFYSFKGGVGRTTALAGFAVQRAREGERVLVIDFDLDAPGAGTLLSGDTGDNPIGVVDYLLEAPLGDVLLHDFVHQCHRESLVGDTGGQIFVMPAGRVDRDYLTKLSRLDLEIRGESHPLTDLLDRAREDFQPDWILIDSRAGLSAAAGVLLDGIAHLHVLFGTNSRQSQLGLEQVIGHLGEERIRRGLPQAKCIIVQTMIVDVVDVEKAARAQFNNWLESTLREHYLVSEDADPEDRMWSVRDVDDRESPNRTVAVPYRARLAFFSSFDDVAPDLTIGPYIELGARILGQFASVDVDPSIDEFEDGTDAVGEVS